MIPMHVVREMVHQKDLEAGRNVDRPKDYILQVWQEMNHIDLDGKAEAHTKWLNTIPQFPKVERNLWRTEISVDISETIKKYLIDKTDFVSVRTIVRGTEINKSTCLTMLLKMFKAGELERIGGGQGCETRYKLASIEMRSE